MRGFTLLETIIAITIIAITSIALVGLGTSTSKQGSYLINKTIATHLAQEGLELVRNIRDTNTIKSLNWDNNIKGTGNEQGGIISYNFPSGHKLDSYFTPPPTDVDACGANCRLYRDATNGFYTHTSTGGNTPTNFYRLILINKDTTDDSRIITSEVKWTDRGKSHIIKVTTKLYDWQ